MFLLVHAPSAKQRAQRLLILVSRGVGGPSVMPNSASRHFACLVYRLKTDASRVKDGLALRDLSAA
jgi:hypothetical protein